MTPERYAEAIAQLGLSQIGTARFLEIGERTSRRYIAGEARVERRVEMLLELMLKYKVTPAEAYGLVNNELPPQWLTSGQSKARRRKKAAA